MNMNIYVKLHGWFALKNIVLSLRIYFFSHTCNLWCCDKKWSPAKNDFRYLARNDCSYLNGFESLVGLWNVCQTSLLVHIEPLEVRKYISAIRDFYTSFNNECKTLTAAEVAPNNTTVIQRCFRWIDYLIEYRVCTMMSKRNPLNRWLFYFIYKTFVNGADCRLFININRDIKKNST